MSPKHGSNGCLTMIAIAIGAIAAIVVGFLMANMIGFGNYPVMAATTHYSRTVSVLASTAHDGSWVIHCHNFRINDSSGKTGTRGTFLFGGCLKPTHIH